MPTGQGTAASAPAAVTRSRWDWPQPRSQSATACPGPSARSALETAPIVANADTDVPSATTFRSARAALERSIDSRDEAARSHRSVPSGVTLPPSPALHAA